MIKDYVQIIILKKHCSACVTKYSLTCKILANLRQKHKTRKNTHHTAPSSKTKKKEELSYNFSPETLPLLIPVAKQNFMWNFPVIVLVT